jgi:hypothetical protein
MKTMNPGRHWRGLLAAFVCGLSFAITYKYVHSTSPGKSATATELPNHEISDSRATPLVTEARPSPDTKGADAVVADSEALIPTPPEVPSANLDPSLAHRNIPLDQATQEKLRLPDYIRKSFTTPGVAKFEARARFIQKLQESESTPWSQEIEARLDALIQEKLGELPSEVTSLVDVRTACMADQCQVQVQTKAVDSRSLLYANLEFVRASGRVPQDVTRWLERAPWIGPGKDLSFVPKISHVTTYVDGAPYVLLLLQKEI